MKTYLFLGNCADCPTGEFYKSYFRSGYRSKRDAARAVKNQIVFLLREHDSSDCTLYWRWKVKIEEDPDRHVFRYSFRLCFSDKPVIQSHDFRKRK